ncbi:AraD1 family protein [Castellaniella defragrans]|uniref:AraD1 family protein n=1 Tax=Castellaniella defragrans TaxID=75697 RepID=UPI0012490856|nr:AraD1 family protein [Castellaniella defragrans]KAB0610740.1 FAH family protein [Castellaniella defragrans]
MRLIQFIDTAGRRRVGMPAADGRRIDVVRGVSSTYELAMAAIGARRTLAAEIAARGRDPADESYPDLLAGLRVLVPLDHEDPAHCLVTGTGLTHLGSAATRDKMHTDQSAVETMTDSMRMFRWGLEGGQPRRGTPGTQPEWFYKGDGGIVVPPGHPIPYPDFAEDAGEEPEIAGLYVIGDDGLPYRLGFALGNEFSDHVMERRNYLYLAHSKLRFCSFGPELRVGEMPRDIRGTSRIRRDGKILWEKPFHSGEGNMSHTLENLEYHHFKYIQFLRPGSVHVHFFGTATLSFADGIQTRPGDEFEIHAPEFGAPLRNPTRQEPAAPYMPGNTVPL